MEHLAVTSQTKGYQGYFGLSWQGHAMNPVGTAFGSAPTSITVDRRLLRQSRSISKDLLDIHRRSTLVTDDLGLIVLNGQIISAKRDAQEFMPVLDEIRSIGHRTRDIFIDSISDLYNTVVSSQLDAVQFHAFLAVDIMDRNLYERANDVRWWALTTRFREILGQPRQSSEDLKTLEEILCYINDLYTVYTNLVVFDAAGKVLAVSNPDERNLLGSSLADQDFTQAALENLDTQRYVVSPFATSTLYRGLHTYIYATSIQDLHAPRVVGGIAIVFDGEPQFRAMLQDALPLDDTGQPIAGAFGLYCYPDGRVIASTLPELPPGSHFDLGPKFAELGNGARIGQIVQYAGHTYVAGAVMSQGYREYKTTNDYSNDIIGLVYMPL